MSDFFRAYKADGTQIPTYFIESTAPNNVDDTAVDKPMALEGLELIEPSDDAVSKIAEALSDAPHPNLVVMVHGFNNPQPAVLEMYKTAAQALAADAAIQNRKGLVCVGYRWPSEKMGQPAEGWWEALPTLPSWILYLGVALVAGSLGLFYLAHGGSGGRSDVFSVFGHALILAGSVMAGLILTALLLRIIVYFRDNYRATNYGVSDLVQIIRAIDSAILERRGGNSANDVQLSFIGHSMGGFVVTNTIRVLSHVFERKVIALNSYGAGSSSDNKPDLPSQNIGHAFSLKRFVLASPDIPAETLLSSRGNFLAAALSRFDEAYLFSNEGDEVLRQISTLANYFVFPAKSRKHGFRLGNVEILSKGYGLIPASQHGFLDTLRIGNKTLQELYDALEEDKASRHHETRVRARALLPEIFTYFDCTDYVEPSPENGKPTGLLTFAKRRKRANAQARLRWYSHLHLLFSYVVHHQKPNVHGGYFAGALSQQLIYRLACLGYGDTVKAYGGAPQMWEACNAKQIRGLLSPHLAAGRSHRAGSRQHTPTPAAAAK
jgi:hypothetical protein